MNSIKISLTKKIEFSEYYEAKKYISHSSGYAIVRIYNVNSQKIKKISEEK